MRALRISQQVTLDDFSPTEVDMPQPGPGEVLVRLKAAALNHRDLHFLNHPIEKPVILGSDGSGIVESIGPGVTDCQPGMEIVIHPSMNWGEQTEVYGPDFSILGGPIDGTFAEAIVLPDKYLYAKPSHLSFEQAAALPLAGLTAFRALFTRANIQPGERVLIHGIGGGVALFALQFAKAAGTRVMVTSTRQGTLDRACDLGADQAVNSQSDDWVQRAREWTDNGVDVVVESIGGDYFTRSLDALRQGGRLVSFGRSASSEASINVGTLFWRQLNILGSMMGSPYDFDAMLYFVNEHRLVPIVDSVRPLAEIGSAFRRMAEGQQFGKLVVTCG